MGEGERVTGVCTECGAPLAFALGATQVRCEHCGGGMAVGEGLVRLDCPVCSGNFYSIDASMGGRCPYCGAPLLALTRHRLLRFLVRPVSGPPAADTRLVLLPFWRLTGLVLGFDFGARVEIVRGPAASSQNVRDGGGEPQPSVTRRDSGPQKAFRGRVVDRHVADPSAAAFGVRSLRLRAAVHPIEPLEADDEELGLVVPPTLPVLEAREALFAVAMTLGTAADGMTQLDCQRADVVAEAVSLLYYPFWVRRSEAGALELWDAVNGEPEPLGPPGPQPEEAAVPATFDELRIVEARCGACGEPLPAGNRVVIFPCSACQTFWVAGRDGLEPFEAGYAKPQVPSPEGAGLIWLPFWQVEAEVEQGGRPARLARDVRDVLGVTAPRGEAPEGSPEAPLCYFVPAYGALRAPRLDHAARDMTRLQPPLEPGSYARGETFRCFFGPEDAERLAYVVLLQVLPGAVPRRAASLRVRTGAVRLWYVPFADGGRELRNLLTGMRYDRAAFQGVGH